MRIPLLVLAALLAAGCSTPSAPTQPAGDEGPVDLTGRIGLFAIDTAAREATLLTSYQAFGWMSPSARYVLWLDDGFSVLLETAIDEREVVASASWTRIFDNGTGLELAPGVASWRALNGTGSASTTSVVDAPHPGSRWSDASADLAVLGAEYAPAERGPDCRNEIFVNGARDVRAFGCHLRVASDGRAGWTEADGVRIADRAGVVTNLSAGGGNATSTTQNPVFTVDGVVYVRVDASEEPARIEVVRDEGAVLAVMEGPRRLTLHDVSEDGRFLLVRVSEG